MSDISNAAQNTPRGDAESAPFADDYRTTSHAVSGKGRFVIAAAAAALLGVAWIALRIAQASVKRHPAVQVTRAGVRAIRDQRQNS